MDEDLKIDEGHTIPKSELWFTASRSGGPGGQHVNKVSSKVTLHWDVAGTGVLDEQERARVMEALGSRLTGDGVLQVHSDESRSQHTNREIAQKRLARLVREALVEPTPRRPTAPSRAQKRRRLDNKKRRSGLKKGRQPPTDE